VSQAGIMLDKIYFCPHSKAENCPCRKPELGLILRAQEELNLDLSNSFFIGDSDVDILAGARAGMKTILIESERLPDAASLAIKPDFVARDLLKAAEIILKQERGAME